MTWKDEFNFEVNEGDKEIDITEIISASMNDPLLIDDNKITYKIVGLTSVKAGDENELIWLGGTGLDSGGKDVSDGFGFANNTYDFTSLGLADEVADKETALDLMYEINANYTLAVHDIASKANRNIEMKTKMSGGRLTLYHKGYPTEDIGRANTKFDNYERPVYSFVVMAEFDDEGSDDKKCDRALTMVNICVKKPDSEFYIERPEYFKYQVTETLGTIAEGKTALENNPRIKLDQWLKYVRHEDSTATEWDDLAVNGTATQKN
jgi:hypothetical protein